MNSLEDIIRETADRPKDRLAFDELRQLLKRERDLGRELETVYRTVSRTAHS